MKDPHDTKEYDTTDEAASSAVPASDDGKRKKPKFSGAYYYVEADEKKLAEAAFVRTILTVIAILLQFVILILPPQASLEYVTVHVASLALFYVVYMFVYIVTAVWLVAMNMTRYKFLKRIPVERAPKNGFKNRAFFGAELFIAANALITVFEITFVSLTYDPITLAAVFLSALALAAAVGARQVTHLALRRSQLVPAPAEKNDKNDTDLK